MTSPARGGCGAARFLLAALAAALLASGWAAGESEWADKPAGGGPPTVTLGTLLSGTCQQVQRYAESLVGSGVLRAAAEVMDAPPATEEGTSRSLFPLSHFNLQVYCVLTSLFLICH